MKHLIEQVSITKLDFSWATLVLSRDWLLNSWQNCYGNLKTEVKSGLFQQLLCTYLGNKQNNVSLALRTSTSYYLHYYNYLILFNFIY